jgi:hypothetical protein
MAITTLDGVIAGFRPPENIFKTGPTMEAAGRMHSLLYAAGLPGAGTAPATGIFILPQVLQMLRLQSRPEYRRSLFPFS